jgi:SRSO17 transposase
MPEESWLANPDRCAAAGVPPDLAFATRPAHVIEMICAARAAGIPFAWFTADEEFGQNPGLCDHLETNRIPYVMAVPKSTQFTDTTGKIARCDKLASRLPPKHLATPRLRHRVERVPGLRLGAHQRRGPRPPVFDPPLHQ